MGRYHPHVGATYEQMRATKEPLMTRSLAAALAIGAPIGIVVWLAIQQMPNITWVISQLFLHAGQ